MAGCVLNKIRSISIRDRNIVSNIDNSMRILDKDDDSSSSGD